MSSRREIALSRSTEWAGEEIRFLPAIRDVDAEWLWLDMAQSPNGDPEALARIAGRIGQLNPGTSSASDSVADWVAFQRHCVELLRALLITRKEIFPSEVSGSLWLLHAVSAPWTNVPIRPLGDVLTGLILEGHLALGDSVPLRMKGLTVAGKVLARGVTECLTANHLLQCDWCGRYFTTDAAKPRRHCTPTCRKAEHANDR